MSKFFSPKKIHIIKSNIPNSGRGVFASVDIKKDEIIEIAPILILEFSDFITQRVSRSDAMKSRAIIDTKWNKLFEYYFWMDDYVALALGYGSLYNHSKDPNCQYELNRKEETITFTAIKDIKKDEEILFNYKGSSSENAPLWFEHKKVVK